MRYGVNREEEEDLKGKRNFEVKRNSFLSVNLNNS